MVTRAPFARSTGLKGEEAQGEDGRGWVEHFFGCGEDEHGQKQTEEGDDEAAAQQNGIRICAVQELRGVQEVLCLEVGDGYGWGLFEAQGKERECDEQLNEWWMFGISAEVGIPPILDAREEMHCLVEGLRLLPDGGDEKDGDEDEESGGDTPGCAGWELAGRKSGFGGRGGLDLKHGSRPWERVNTERGGSAYVSGPPSSFCANHLSPKRSEIQQVTS